MRNAVLFLFLLLSAFHSGLNAQNAELEAELNHLNELSFEAFDAYDYRRAIDLQHTCLKLIRNQGPEQDTNRVALYSNVGSFYQRFQLYDSALFFLERAESLAARSLTRNNYFYLNAALQLGGLYEALDMLDKAESLNDKAIQAASSNTEFSETDLFCFLLSNQAIVKKKKGNLVQAEALVRSAMKKHESLFGSEGEDMANYLNTLGLIQLNSGKIKQAGETLNEAKLKCERTGKHKKSTTYASILGNLATLSSNKGNHPEARRLYEEDYAIKAKVYGAASLEAVVIYENLAMTLSAMGDYQGAINLLKKAGEIKQRLLGKAVPELFQNRIYLCQVYEQMGDYARAREEYNRLVPEIRQALGKADIYVIALNNQTLMQISSGEYAPAEANFKELFELSGQMDPHTLLTVKNNYSTLLSHTNRMELSRTYLEEVMKGYAALLGEENPDYALAVLNLGVQYLNENRLEEAARYFRQSKSIMSQLAGTAHPFYLESQYNLASVAYEQKKYEEALRIYTELASTYRSNLGEQNLKYADVLAKEALCLNQLDRSNEFHEKLLKSFEIRKQILGADNPLLAYENTLLATYYTYTGDLTKGIQYYREATRLSVKGFNTFFRFMTEKEKLEFLDKNLTELKQLQAVAIENAAKKPEFAGLAIDIELLTKGMVLESGNRLRDAVKRRKDPALQQKFADYLNKKQQVAHEFSKPAPDRRKDLADLEREVEDMEKSLTQALGETDLLDLRQTSWKDLAGQLKKDEVLVEFLRYKTFQEEKESVMAIIIRPGNTEPVLVPLYSEVVFQQYLNKTRKAGEENTVLALYGESRGIDEVEDLVPQHGDDSLYFFVWQPLEKYLSGVRRIYYSPAGSLHKVAFAALSDKSGRFVSATYDLVTLSSGSQLREKPGRLTFQSALLVGGVNYNTTQQELLSRVKPEATPVFALRGAGNESSWSYLPGTLQETEALSDVLKPVCSNLILLKEDEAYEENVKQELARLSPEILHMSTHGYFFPEGQKPGGNVFRTSANPLIRSGLILSGANYAWQGGQVSPGLEDGVFTALEVAAMDLSNTGLAVLSACQTGLGDVAGSEGVFGLQRAFKQAGVEYLVMSLWQVPDKETMEFMRLFYQELGKGTPVETAFNKAQGEMRAKYPPYYWAAFVLIR